jgi:hypothetical protein
MRQDVLLSFIFKKESQLFEGAGVILGGGTALARCYLEHRASYDLDFFVDRSFDPQLLLRRLKDAGLKLTKVETLAEPMYAVQLHGMAVVKDEPIRINIVEDIHAGMFPVVTVKGIRTETIEGLYHRKLRTLTGTADTITETGRRAGKGARQTARDLFDIYVLGKEFKPVMDFVAEINSKGANVSELALVGAIRNIRWMDLMDEFEILEIADRFKGLTAYDVKRSFDKWFRPKV